MERILINPNDERTILDFRTLGFDDVLVVGRYDYSDMHQPLEAHEHGDLYEVCYLHRGQQTYTVADDRFGEGDYHLRGGDLFVTAPGELHSTGSDGEERGKLYWILLRQPKKNRRFLQLSTEESASLRQQLETLPGRHFPADSDIYPLLESIFEMFARPDDALKPARLRARLTTLLLAILDSTTTASPAALSREIQTACQWIDANLAEPVALEALAEIAKMSLSRFKTQFKSETGIGPREFIQRRQIDRAQTMLAAGQSVTQTAMDLGFSSSQYFSTVFKRFTGQTPSDFLTAK